MHSSSCFLRQTASATPIFLMRLLKSRLRPCSRTGGQWGWSSVRISWRSTLRSAFSRHGSPKLGVTALPFLIPWTKSSVDELRWQNYSVFQSINDSLFRMQTKWRQLPCRLNFAYIFTPESLWKLNFVQKEKERERLQIFRFERQSLPFNISRS